MSDVAKADLGAQQTSACLSSCLLALYILQMLCALIRSEHCVSMFLWSLFSL